LRYYISTNSIVVILSLLCLYYFVASHRCVCNSEILSKGVYYLAIQRSFWRDIKFAFFVFFCTIEDISTQDGAIGVKFLLRVEQTPGTGTR